MKQKDLLEYLEGKVREIHKCTVCGKEFPTSSGLRKHFTRRHVVKMASGVELREIDGETVQLNIRMRKTMLDTLLKTLERAGVELDDFLSECFMFGDSLFDRDVKPLIEEKAARRIVAPMMEEIVKKEGVRERPKYIA
jgi:arginyl-tRNA synthetase